MAADEPAAAAASAAASAPPPPPPPLLRLRVVFVPNLLRHTACGWTEYQLVTGRVHVLGRETLDLSLAAASTLAGGVPALRQWPGRSGASTFQPWWAR